MALIFLLSVLILIFNIVLFCFGLYYYRKAKKQHDEFLNIEIEFYEYLEFKKDIEERINL